MHPGSDCGRAKPGQRDASSHVPGAISRRRCSPVRAVDTFMSMGGTSRTSRSMNQLRRTLPAMELQFRVDNSGQARMCRGFAPLLRLGSTFRALMLAAIIAVLVPQCGETQIAPVAVGTKVDRAMTIQLTPQGFRPGSVSMPAGTVALVLENRSGVRNLSIQLIQDGQSTASLTSQHAPGSQDQWQWVGTKAGTYHLIVVGRPAWTCAVTILAK